MNFHVLTLFPEMIEQGLHTSILGKAMEKGCITLETTNIRDFSANKYNRVDDYPYGGGAGMVMEAEPVYRACRSVEEKIGKSVRTVYLTPQGKVLNQTMVEELAMEEDLILLCGHYEGIDERVLEEVVTDYVSIGDYVLTGGELGAMVLIDAVSRFVPGVLSNEESSQFESLQDNLLEYPHYTRPEEWRGKRVPAVLLSGDHKKIESWRYEKSVERTKERRPDLMKNAVTVACAYYAPEENWREVIEMTVGEMTRYGKLLDVGRKKIRKQKNIFGRRDFLLTAVPAQLPEDFPVESQEELLEGFRGDRTKAAVIVYGKEEDQKQEVAERMKEILQKRKFRVLDVCLLPEREEERRRFLLRLRDRIYKGTEEEAQEKEFCLDEKTVASLERI